MKKKAMRKESLKKIPADAPLRNRPISLRPISFDEAVERLVNVKRAPKPKKSDADKAE